MNKLAPMLAVLLCATAFRAPAQISAEVTIEQQQFLPGEAIPVAVKITNRSGRTLHIGDEPDWLTFSIEGHEGGVVSKRGEVPVPGGFDLDSSKRASVPAELAPYFNFSKPGRYTVTATVRIKGWDQLISSPPKGFDIIQGSKLWEQEFGVPNTTSTNGMPEIRRYTLHQANYLRGQLRLYLQVNDRTGKLNKVFPIGPMLSFGQPEHQIDRLSNLHVLYQDGPHSFSYTLFNPDGELLLRQTYAYTTRPRLLSDEAGNFTVAGGTVRPNASDFPPPAAGSNEIKSAP